MIDDLEADVYSVGLLHDLQMLGRTLLHAPKHARQPMRSLWRDFWQHRARRSYWNGYLAEPLHDGAWTRCGHGWTRRRAIRDLARHLAGAR